jgi:hypothetical protein
VGIKALEQTIKQSGAGSQSWKTSGKDKDNCFSVPDKSPHRKRFPNGLAGERYRLGVAGITIRDTCSG